MDMQEKRGNVNNPPSDKEIELIVKNLPTRKFYVSMASLVSSSTHFKQK